MGAEDLRLLDELREPLKAHMADLRDHYLHRGEEAR